MSTTKERVGHTPGPWHLENGHIAAHDQRWGQSTGRVWIAETRRHRLGSADCVCPDDIQDSNEMLILSAPDLLDTCEELVAILSNIDGLSVKEFVALRTARDVIDKATQST